MNAKKNSEQKVVQDTRHQEKKRKIAKPEENTQTWGGFFLLFVFCFVFFFIDILWIFVNISTYKSDTCMFT